MSDQEVGEERALVFRLELDDPDLLHDAVTESMPGKLPPNEHAKMWDERFAVLEAMARRFSVELIPDRGTAALVDSQNGDNISHVKGHLTVGLTADERCVVLQLPSDLPMSTTGWIGFSPAEARGLAAILEKKANEALAAACDQMTDEQLLEAIPRSTPGSARQAFGDWRDRMQAPAYDGWHSLAPARRRIIYEHCSDLVRSDRTLRGDR